MTLHVLVASDHAIIREGLVQLLSAQRDLRAWGARLDERPPAESAAHVILCVADGRPDLDTVLQQLEAMHPGVPVLCLLLSQNDTAVVSALRSGVRGVIDETFSAEHLVESIQQCADGQFVMSRPLATRLARQYAVGQGPAPLVGPETELTHREREVLSLLAEGCTNREIAGRLCLSEHTVRAHLRAIMQKLQVTNRVQAATIALQSRLTQRELAAKGVGHANPGR